MILLSLITVFSTNKMLRSILLNNLSKDEKKYFVLVGVVVGLMTFVYGAISYQNQEYSEWDLHDYRAMAQASPSLTESVRQPFVYRILGPYIAGLLPFSTDNSFLIMSISSGLVLSLLFYLYLGFSGFEPQISALATILFILNKYLFGFTAWNYFQLTDILSLIEIVLMMWAMTSEKWLLFGIVLFFGALTKETALIMIPVALIYLVDTNSFDKKWRIVLAATLPASLMAIVLRIVLHSQGGNSLSEAFLVYSDKLILPETWFRLLINSFIPFSLLPLIFIDSAKDYFRTRKYAFVYLTLVLISTLFGYNNERLMAPAFIVFYPLIATIIRDHSVRSRWILLTIIGMAILSCFHHTYSRFPLPRDVTIASSLLGMAIVTLSGVYWRIKNGKSKRVAST